MWQEVGMNKWLGVVVAMAMAVLSLPAWAQSQAPTVTPAPAEWQVVIEAQVQAFRDHDAAAAFSYSAAPFHTTYKDPEEFFLAIVNAGYAPMMESQSESFGPYELVTPTIVYQDVKFVGRDQSFYEAIYRLTKEPAGWRVESVQLGKAPGAAA
jgi:hypothetical protein